MGTFAVVFTDDHRPDLETFAPELAGILGLSVIDARIRIRKGRGIFLERLDADTARRVADALTACGWAADVVPGEDLLRFARPARLFQVDCRDDVFRYKRSMAEPDRDVPWDRIRLVHAGLVATPQYRDLAHSKTFRLLPTMARIDDPEARAQLKRAMARKALQREVDAPPGLPEEGRPLAPDALADLARNSTDAYLDLFVEGRQGFLRADRRQVVLDYLGEQGGANSLESFKRFAADVAARATGALVTPSARRLLDGEKLPGLVYDDLAEYERYIAWVCLRNGIAPPQGGKIPAPEDTPALPEDLQVTACPTCGTVVAAGTDRCAYCKVELRPRRRRSRWKVIVPLLLLWGLAAGAGLLYQEQTRRREAVDRVRFYTCPSVPGSPARTVEEAIREDLKWRRHLKPAGWGVSRRGPGLYEVDFALLREGYDTVALQVDRIRFLVDLDGGEVRPLDPEAAQYIPPPGPPPGAAPDPPSEAPAQPPPPPPTGPP